MFVGVTAIATASSAARGRRVVQRPGGAEMK
jgi:hypothetical protein